MKLLTIILAFAILCISCTKKLSVPDEIKLKRGSLYSEIFYNASQCESKGLVNTTKSKYVFNFDDSSIVKKIIIPKGVKMTFKFEINLDTLKGNSKNLLVKPTVKDFIFSFSKPIVVKIKLKNLKKPIAVKISNLSLNQL